MTHLINTFIAKAEDDPEDTKEIVDTLQRMTEGKAGSPEKRARLTSEDFDVPVSVRNVLGNYGDRLTRVEMSTGRKPDEGYEGKSLWDTTAEQRGHMLSFDSRLTLASGAATSANNTANEAMSTVTQLQTSAAPTANMATRVQTLEAAVKAAHNKTVLLQEVAQQALKMVLELTESREFGNNAGIPAAAGGMVSSADYHTNKRKVEDDLRTLYQLAGDTEVSIMGRKFKDRTDADDFVASSAFPDHSYECIVGLGALLQHVSSGVSTQLELASEEVHARKVGRTPLQNSMVASFSLPLPEYFRLSAASSMSAKPSIIKLPNAASWYPPSTGGFRRAVQREMDEKIQELEAHIMTVLEHHIDAKTLCLGILAEVRTWWTWFSAAFTDFHNDLLDKACPSGTAECSKEVKDQAWQVATSALLAFFEETRKVRAQASAATHARTPKETTAVFLHATLQEMRVMKEFQQKHFANHPRIQLLKMTHVFDTYVPRGEVDFVAMAGQLEKLKTEVDTLQTKVGNLGKGGKKKE